MLAGSEEHWQTTDFYEMPLCPVCGEEMVQGHMSDKQADKIGSPGPDYWWCETEKCSFDRRKRFIARQNAEFRETQAQDNFLEKYNVDRDHLRCSFDNFTPKKISEKYIELCNSFEMNQSMNLFLYGKTGVGKTHIAVSILRRIIVRKFADNCYFKSMARLMLELRDVYASDNSESSEKSITDTYTRLSLLILDDLGAEKPTDFTERVLYNIIATRLDNQLRTIITSNLSVDEVNEIYGPRIGSRLSSYELIECEGKDWRKKR